MVVGCFVGAGCRCGGGGRAPGRVLVKLQMINRPISIPMINVIRCFIVFLSSPQAASNRYRIFTITLPHLHLSGLPLHGV